MRLNLPRTKRVHAVYVGGYSFLPSRAYRMGERKLAALVERVLSTGLNKSRQS